VHRLRKGKWRQITKEGLRAVHMLFSHSAWDKTNYLTGVLPHHYFLVMTMADYWTVVPPSREDSQEDRDSLVKEETEKIPNFSPKDYYFILDGNHRYTMIRKLLESHSSESELTFKVNCMIMFPYTKDGTLMTTIQMDVLQDTENQIHTHSNHVTDLERVITLARLLYDSKTHHSDFVIRGNGKKPSVDWAKLNQTYLMELGGKKEDSKPKAGENKTARQLYSSLMRYGTIVNHLNKHPSALSFMKRWMAEEEEIRFNHRSIDTAAFRNLTNPNLILAVLETMRLAYRNGNVNVATVESYVMYERLHSAVLKCFKKSKKDDIRDKQMECFMAGDYKEAVLVIASKIAKTATDGSVEGFAGKMVRRWLAQDSASIQINIPDENDNNIDVNRASGRRSTGTRSGAATSTSRHKSAGRSAGGLSAGKPTSAKCGRPSSKKKKNHEKEDEPSCEESEPAKKKLSPCLLTSLTLD
jgi:hypothetical protein